MSKIYLKNIYKKFDNNENYAVQDFSLEIEEKEFIVIVGPSGCGKSTTIRMIAGLEDITKGELFIDDKLMNKIAPKNRGIAMVFQNYALYPHMTVYDNIAFGLKIRKYNKNEIKERVYKASEILGLEELLSRKPSALSGGQRQRVALGRAIVRDTKIFLMDEPLSNLDAKLRVQMRSEVSRLHNNLDSTTVYVTHDQTEAMTMASRIIIMKDGLIQQIGEPVHVYNFPKNKFVASFIGSPSMNFFDISFSDGVIFFKTKDSMKLIESDAKILFSNGYNDQDLILGIRPEDIFIIDCSEVINENFINGKVLISELLGSETLIHLENDKQKFTVKINGQLNIKSGTVLKFGFNMSKVHFFDKISEESIVDKTISLE